jgi:hypothetical protein
VVPITENDLLPQKEKHVRFVGGERDRPCAPPVTNFLLPMCKTAWHLTASGHGSNRLAAPFFQLYENIETEELKKSSNSTKPTFT